jgi:acetoin utilization protein AcuB
MELSIEKFMTHMPQTISPEQTLATAHRMMRELEIRHLPVLDRGKLRGIVTQRDLLLIETLRDVDPETVQVSEAMTVDVFTVGPRASVREVAADMASRKCGCVVVVNHEHVVGVFTTIDALTVLSALLEQTTTTRRS